MVNATCCGGQDRNTTVRGNQEIPPVETRNCYLNEGNGQSTFDYMNCAGADTACTGEIMGSNDELSEDNGGCLACKASSGGGYCDIDGIYYSSRGMGTKFHKLTESDDIAKLTKSNLGIGEMSRMFERERQRTINRQRQSEINNQRRNNRSSSNTETIQDDSTEETTITDYITTMLLYIGVSATFIVMILSIVLIILK
jgi:hypothetical protein